MNKQSAKEVKQSSQHGQQHQQKAASDKNPPNQLNQGANKPKDSGKQKS